MALMDQGVGLGNGQVAQNLDPTLFGATNPDSLNEIPHVDTNATPGLPGPTHDDQGNTLAPQASQGSKVNNELRAKIEKINIAEDLDEDRLRKIAYDAIQGYEDDLMSREPWEDNLDVWMKLATQVYEEKTYPWPMASNVKYPLITTAAMQFNARAYPSLVPSDGHIVKTQVVGKDKDGTKKDKADRVSSYMSYQIMYEMKGWEEDMDKLLLMLPVVGTVFKKTYYCNVKKRLVSCLVPPKNLVVNYWADCLEGAQRITEVIEMTKREIKESQLAGIFRDVDLSPPEMSVLPERKENLNQQQPPRADDTTPYKILEQHTFLDLNDDGYSEPYIVTLDYASKKVLRIVARFDDKSIFTDDDGKVIRIDPIQYYTKFPFIPNPDGGFYDIGFGHLLGPMNEAVNSLINQLIDSGTLNNLSSGFIGKGLRLRMGETRLQPGEWRAVNSTGDDLKKQIVPLPAKEPSNVLFQLMGSLVQSGKELASVAEIFVGKMPGQNTPATTTMATIEQGMKVFTAVYKRVYRALESEFRKLFRLNEVYLDYDTYSEVVEVGVNPDDFDANGYDICPAADPAATSQTEKLVKAQALMELLPTGMVDPLKVITRLLDAMEIPNWQELISQSAQPGPGGQQQQKPDPVMLDFQLKQQAEQQKNQMQQAKMSFDAQMDQRDQAFQQQMAQYKAATEQQLAAQKANAASVAQQAQVQARMDSEARMNHQRMQQQAEQHSQAMVHKQQQHEAHLRSQKSQSQNQKSPHGKPKK